MIAASPPRLLEHIWFARGPAIGKARCEPGWRWSPPPLADYDLWYAVDGYGVMQANGRTYPIKPGSCFLVRPGDTPLAEQDPDRRLVVIFIHFDIIAEHPASPGGESGGEPSWLPPFCTEVEDVPYFERLLNRILEVDARMEPWQDEEFNGLMKLVFLQLHRSWLRRSPDISPKQQQAVARAMTFIREHIGRKLSHEEIAAQVQLSQQYFGVLFRKCAGISLKEFIARERLKRAMHLLTETSMNVSQVSDALGYSNIYWFSRQFKQHFGSPPSKFMMKEIPSKPHIGQKKE